MAIINAQCGHRNHTMPAPFWNEPSTRRYRRPGYGVGWLIGSVVTGLLYEQSHLALVLFAVIVQLASLPLIERSERSVRRQTESLNAERLPSARVFLFRCKFAGICDEFPLAR
jgi:hypothetical protein